MCSRYGPPEVLRLEEVPKPVPRDNEILVKVFASTVTAADIRIRSFTVPPLFWLPGRLSLGLTGPRNKVLGLELSREIEAVGGGAQRFGVGDKVFAYTPAHNFGANAEYKCLPENGLVAVKPSSLTFEEAAAVPFGGVTALHFLRAGGVGPGQRVLVYGASGAVGVYAVQLAKHFGAEVTGVCSSGNMELVKSLGADRVIDYTRGDVSQDGETYDVVFDAVSKLTYAQSKALLKPEGVLLDTVVVIPPLEGAVYRARTGRKLIGGDAPRTPEDLIFLGGLIEAGTLTPVLGAIRSPRLSRRTATLIRGGSVEAWSLRFHDSL